MIFLHIIDDYRLQGILASMKQKNWWREQKEYKELYKCDYIWALLMHSFSWAFMVMLPIAYVMNFNITGLFAIVFIANVLIHAFVDDLKANKRKINLIQDQTIHLMQIIITFIILL
jgi:hypothetical protein